MLSMKSVENSRVKAGSDTVYLAHWKTNVSPAEGRNEHTHSGSRILSHFFFFFQAEDGIRDLYVTGVQTCALPIFPRGATVASTIDAQPTVTRATKLIGLDGNDVDAVRVARMHDHGKTEIGGHAIGDEIGRASCREECRSRWWPDHLKKKKVK